SHLYTLFCIEHPAITYLYTLSLHDALPIYNLEKTVLDDKAAVIERAVLLQQITQIDTIIKIANLGNEQDVIPARSAGAGECQNGLKSSGAERHHYNCLGVIVIRILTAYLFGKLARIVENISHRFEGIGYVNVTKRMQKGYAADQ